MNIEKLRKLKHAVSDENWSMVEIHVDDMVCEAESNPHEPIVNGTRYTEHEWLGRAVRGAIPRGVQDGEPITECPRWVAVRDAFSCGSTYAVALCKEFGLDPHKTISR